MRKYIALALTLVLSLNAPAKNQSNAKQIETAVDLIHDISQGGATKVILKPNTDAKEMLKAFAAQEYQTTDEEFAEQWTDNETDAWGADEGSWSMTDLAGGRGYVKFALAQSKDDGAFDNDDGKYNEALAKAKKAFAILGAAPNVAYGISPRGAIQCGVTFAALVIMDLENGIVYEISMEGSGC